MQKSNPNLYNQGPRRHFESGWANTSEVFGKCFLKGPLFSKFSKSGWAMAHPPERALYITLWYTKLGKSLNFNDDVLSIWNCIGNMDSDITQHHCLEPGDREISAELLYGCWIWILFTRKSFAHMIRDRLRGHPHITSPPFWYFWTPSPLSSILYYKVRHFI